MPIDCHIKIDGVDSESTHVDHKGEIDVSHWTWGVEQPTGVGSGIGGHSKGKAIPREFIFHHRYDKASPVIGKYCATGKHFEKVVCTSRQAGEGQKTFLKITLKKAIINSAEIVADVGGDVMEIVSLAYGDIEFEYNPMDSKGVMGGAVKFGWDIETTATR
ncbi:type VI secretion system tube protein Hcp [soil metagenome]